MVRTWLNLRNGRLLIQGGGEALLATNLIADLDKVAVNLSVSTGSVLFRSGEPALAVYVVRKGSIDLVWADSRCVFVMDTLGPGNIVGLPASVKGTYTLTARAAEDCELGYVYAGKCFDFLLRIILSVWQREVLSGQKVVA